jgi:hypothetical protein
MVIIPQLTIRLRLLQYRLSGQTESFFPQKPLALRLVRNFYQGYYLNVHRVSVSKLVLIEKAQIRRVGESFFLFRRFLLSVWAAENLGLMIAPLQGWRFQLLTPDS